MRMICKLFGKNVLLSSANISQENHGRVNTANVLHNQFIFGFKSDIGLKPILTKQFTFAVV